MRPATRRLPRILLNAATAVSLALFIAVSVLWTRSRFVGDRVVWLNTAGLNWVESSGGSLAVARVPGITADLGHWEWHRGRANASPDVGAPLAFSTEYHPTADIPVLGLRRIEGVQSYPARRKRPDGTTGIDLVDYPFRLTVIEWRSVVLPTALLPTAAFGPRLVRRARALARRPRRPGECPRCGYDLRATPERCPECGTVAKGVEA